MEKQEIEEKLDREVARVLVTVKGGRITGKKMEAVTYGKFLSDKMMIIGVIRRGVPYSMFRLIKDFSPFTELEWADLLDISTKSLGRFKKTSKYSFKPSISEKIIEVAEVARVGMEVFGDMDKFKAWLDTENFALGNVKPLDLLKDSYGKSLVIGELTRIEHGIFA